MVHTIITELAVFEVTPQGLVLIEIDPQSSLEEVRRLTACEVHRTRA